MRRAWRLMPTGISGRPFGLAILPTLRSARAVPCSHFNASGFLGRPDIRGIYNAGFENLSILQIANMVIEHVPADIIITESQDLRSYRVNSDKLLATGFTPSKTVEDAVMLGNFASESSS